VKTHPVFDKYDYVKRFPARKCYPPNFGAIDLGNLAFRGGAPNRNGRDMTRSLRCLKRKGVRTIMILNQSEQDVSVEDEILVVEDIGLEFERVDWGVLVAEKRRGVEPTWKRVRKMLKQGRIFVHCVWGADRTGAIVARYRTQCQEWPKKDAQFELSSYGWALAGTIPREELMEYQQQVLWYFGCPVSVYEPLGPPEKT